MTLDENREQWQSEKKDAAEFWDSFLTNLRRVKAERAAKDPVYVPEPISWDIMIGATSFRFNFQPSDLANLSSILATEGYPTFKGLENSLNWGRGDLDSDIAAKEPKRDDYFLTANYIKSREEWERNRKEANDFFTEFEKRLNEAIQERAKKDPVYRKTNIIWNAKAPTFSHKFKVGDENKLAAILTNATENDFDWLEQNYQAGCDRYYFDVYQKKAIKPSDFFLPSNYQKADAARDQEYIDFDAFQTKFPSELNALRKAKEQADPKYQEIPIVWYSIQFGVDIDEYDPITENDFLQFDLQTLDNASVELTQFGADLQARIVGNEPKQKDYWASKNYVDAQKQWADNQQRAGTFIVKLQSLISRAKQTLQGNAGNPPQQPAVPNAPTPTSPAPLVDNPSAFPNSIDDVTVVKRLGGSTGAQLVKGSDGTLYVMKRGNSEEHLRSECYTDAFYRAAGVSVPEFRLYDTPSGPVKLSLFFDGTQSLKDWWAKASKKKRDAMSVELRKDFAADILLGNWDVVGLDADNILIDKNGKPWRIDNGGALSFKAQGAPKKDSDWNDGFVDDLWSMTGNGARIGNTAPTKIPQYFGNVDVLEMADAINKRDWTAALAKLPQDQRQIVEKRLEEIRQLADRGNGFDNNGFVRDFTLSILDETYKYSKDGLREACSFTCDLENGDFGWFRSGRSSRASSNPNAQKDQDLQDKILAALKTVNHHNKAGGDKQPNQTTVNSALALKQSLQDALNNGLPNAQHYLDILDAIESAVANQTTTPNFDTSLPVFSAQPQSGQPTKPALQNQFTSLSQFLRDRLGDNAVDFIEDCNKSQGGYSYDVESCYTKMLRLRSQGIDLNNYATFAGFYNDAKQAGYYLGIKNGPYPTDDHYDNNEQAFNYYKNDKALYDKNYEYMTKYNAAIQIALENTDFTGNDKTSRQVLLGRTESDGVLSSVSQVNEGEKCTHRTGVNESHFVWRTVVVEGSNLTMVRVPYSRINGLYMMESHRGDMYLGDGENEISVDSHGLPIYYVKTHINAREKLSTYTKRFEQIEKQNP